MSEAQIVNKLVEAILAKGYSISLEAEYEPFLDNSRDKDEILRNVDASDYMLVKIDESDRWFLLIWGNDEDIISDFAATPLCNEIYEEVRQATGI